MLKSLPIRFSVSTYDETPIRNTGTTALVTLGPFEKVSPNGRSEVISDPLSAATADWLARYAILEAYKVSAQLGPVTP